MAKRNINPDETKQRYRDIKTKGVEQTLPGTNRVVHLRPVEAVDVLKANKMPDILTPFLVKAVYEQLSARAIKDYLTIDRGTVEQAIELAESVDFITKLALADDTKVEELTLAEKRWIFQLVLGPAEILANFRLEQEGDVETVAEGETVQSTT